MRKQDTLTLAAVGNTTVLPAGRLEVQKGHVMRGIRLIMTVALANASGGAVQFTAAQIRSFLGGYRITLGYGRQQRRKPYNAITLEQLRRTARYLLGSDWEGLGDTTTGLGRSLSNGNTHSVIIDVVIPTGYFWQLGLDGKKLGVGRTQAKTMTLSLKREADTLPTGVTVSGSVTFDVVADEFPRRGPEQWMYLPEVVELTETAKQARLPAGLPLYLGETSAVLTSSTLTNVAVYLDNLQLHHNVSVAEIYRQAINDLPNVPTAADLSDVETPLYVVPPYTETADLAPGALIFEQVVKTNTSVSLRALIAPIPEDSEVREDLQDAAGKNGRNKTLRAVAVTTALGMELAPEIVPYLPVYLYDPDDAGFEAYPGLVSDGTMPGEVYIPASVVERARAAVQAFRAAGEGRQAEEVLRAVAVAVWGGVQDTQGYRRKGSRVLDQVRVTVEG